MRIAMVGPPMEGIGGIQQYCRTLKRALEELGHDVMIVTKYEPTWFMGLWMAERLIITHRHYLPLLILCPYRDVILLLHGIDAEAPLTWWERMALGNVSTIWVISEWTKGLAKKFGKQTEVLYLACPDR